MRGRVTLILLLSSLFFSTAAVPQCDYRLQHSAPLRSTYFDLALEGNDLWAATGYGVQLFDRTFDPPRLVAFLAVPGTTRSIDIRSGVAYAGSGNAVYVIRRTGDELDIVAAHDVAATVNDIVVTNGALFAGTENGLVAFDRRDPFNLAAPVILPTSGPSVLALARNGENEVLAADGDASVERFTVSSSNVTPAGSLIGLDRSLSVAVAGQRIFVSDAQQTKIFTASGALDGTSPVSAISVAAGDGDTFFAGGLDRRFRAVDLRLPAQPVEVFARDVLPAGGTVNRVTAMVRADNRLYVAGGDSGLITIDIAGFRAPYALRTQTFGPLTSLADGGNAIVAANALGGLTEYTRFSSGLLAAGSYWADAATHVVHDLRNDILLTSNGTTIRYWSTRPVPSMLQVISLPGAIAAAVLEDNGAALALLEDGTVWRLTVQSSTATATSVPRASLLGRSDRGVALAEVTESGTTIRFYGNGNLFATPASVAIPGAATAMAIGGSRVAVFTFRGITVVDFSAAPATAILLPDSATAVVRDLAVAGNRVLDITANALRLWDIGQRTLIRTYSLSAEALSLSLHPSAPTATILHADGITTVDYESTTPQPVQLAVTGVNRYPRKAVAASDRLFVFDGQTIEVYGTAFSSAPRFAASISVPGAIDLAASQSLLFVLFGDGRVNAYAHMGTPLRTTTIDEGSDMQPLAIAEAGGAPWVSILRGCITTGCETKTIVLDPQSLVRTAALEGDINDLAVSGTFAYVISDMLTSIVLRSYSIADPLHPMLVASRPTEGSAAAVAVAGSIVYTLGTHVFAYTPSLTRSGEFLQPAPISGSTDIAVDEGCAIVTGRSVAAELYTRSGVWPRSGLLSLPGNARGIMSQNGKLIILTDYSIEIWSRGETKVPGRRRAASF